MNEELKAKFETMCRFFGMTDEEFYSIVGTAQIHKVDIERPKATGTTKIGWDTSKDFGANSDVTPEERLKYTGTTIDQHGDTSHNYDFKGKLEVFKVPSNEIPEFVECIDRLESSVLCEGFIYKLKNSDKAGYEVYLTYDQNHSGWYDKERFKPSKLS